MCLLRRTLPWCGPGRGASAQYRSSIRHARCGLSNRLVTMWSVLVAVMIGIDPHKGSHTAVAVGAAEEPLGTLLGPGMPGPGREAGRLGAGLAGADLGGGGRPGAGRPAGPAAGRRWRAGAGRAAQAGCPGAAAANREHRQERPERCPVGGGGGAAVHDPARSDRRCLRLRAEGAGQKASRSFPGPQPGRLPAACAALRADSRRGAR
jgi:hypothetical protein